MLETKIFIFFGTLSYSIYISHYFVISIIKADMSILAKFGYWHMVRMDERLYIDFGSSIIANVYVLLNLCIVVLVAYVLHKYIEKPCIEYGRYYRKTFAS